MREYRINVAKFDNHSTRYHHHFRVILEQEGEEQARKIAQELKSKYPAPDFKVTMASRDPYTFRTEEI